MEKDRRSYNDDEEPESHPDKQREKIFISDRGRMSGKGDQDDHDSRQSALSKGYRPAVRLERPHKRARLETDASLDTPSILSDVTNLSLQRLKQWISPASPDGAVRQDFMLNLNAALQQAHQEGFRNQEAHAILANLVSIASVKSSEPAESVEEGRNFARGSQIYPPPVLPTASALKGEYGASDVMAYKPDWLRDHGSRVEPPPSSLSLQMASQSIQLPNRLNGQKPYLTETFSIPMPGGASVIRSSSTPAGRPDAPRRTENYRVYSNAFQQDHGTSHRSTSVASPAKEGVAGTRIEVKSAEVPHSWGKDSWVQKPNKVSVITRSQLNKAPLPKAASAGPAVGHQLNMLLPNSVSPQSRQRSAPDLPPASSSSMGRIVTPSTFKPTRDNLPHAKQHNWTEVWLQKQGKGEANKQEDPSHMPDQVHNGWTRPLSAGHTTGQKSTLPDPVRSREESGFPTGLPPQPVAKSEAARDPEKLGLPVQQPLPAHGSTHDSRATASDPAAVQLLQQCMSTGHGSHPSPTGALSTFHLSQALPASSIVPRNMVHARITDDPEPEDDSGSEVLNQLCVVKPQVSAVTPLQSLPPGTEDFRATYQHQQSRQNAWDGSQEVHRPMPGVSANALPSIMTLSSMEAVRQKTAREAIQSGLSSKDEQTASRERNHTQKQAILAGSQQEAERKDKFGDTLPSSMPLLSPQDINCFHRQLQEHRLPFHQQHIPSGLIQQAVALMYPGMPLYGLNPLSPPGQHAHQAEALGQTAVRPKPQVAPKLQRPTAHGAFKPGMQSKDGISKSCAGDEEEVDANNPFAIQRNLKKASPISDDLSVALRGPRRVAATCDAVDSSGNQSRPSEPEHKPSSDEEEQAAEILLSLVGSPGAQQADFEPQMAVQPSQTRRPRSQRARNKKPNNRELGRRGH